MSYTIVRYAGTTGPTTTSLVTALVDCYGDILLGHLDSHIMVSDGSEIATEEVVERVRDFIWGGVQHD